MRKLILISIALAAIALVLVPVITSCRVRHTAKTLANLEYFLTVNDAKTREWAAGELIDGFPERAPELRIIQAQALIELGRGNQARVLLEQSDDPKDTARHRQILTLIIESYLQDSASRIERTKPEKADVAAAQILSMISRAADARAKLEQLPDTAPLTQNILARETGLQLQLLRLQLQAPAHNYAKAEAADEQDQATPLSETVEQLESQIRILENRLVQTCASAIQSDPTDPQPRQILFAMWLEARQFNQARRMAATLAEMPDVDPTLAGRFAGTLLDLEARYAEPVTNRDLDVAATLLDHPSIPPKPPLDVDIARIRLALRLHDPALAEQRALDVLARYPQHPRATTLLAQALCELKRPEQAIEALDAYIQKHPSNAVRFALGSAVIAAGDDRRGRELIHQSLDVHPYNLPARILLAQTLVDSDRVLDAEADIRAAIRLNPTHPHVRALYARLLVEQLDRIAVRRLITGYLNDPATDTSWKDAAIVAAMMLDDRQSVARLADDHGGLIAEFAKGWHNAPRMNRFETAAIVVRALLQHIDRPLDRVCLPPLNPRAAINLQSTPHTVDPLAGSTYVPWPIESALQLVETALLTWPNEPWLLDISARIWLCLGHPQQARRRLDAIAAFGHEPSPTANAVLAYLRRNDNPSTYQLSLADAPPDGDATLRWVILASILPANDPDRVDQLLGQMLTDQHWPEPVLLTAIAHAHQNNQPEQVQRYIKTAQRLNPTLGELALIRYKIALHDFAGATVNAKLLVRSEDSTSELRRLVADLLAQTGLALGNVEIAVGMFENLALAHHGQQLQMRLAAIDLLIDAGRTTTAGIILESLITHATTSGYDTDLILARASNVMRPETLRTHLDQLFELNPDDPIALFYLARLHRRQGEPLEAETAYQTVLRLTPNALRPTLELADTLAANAQPDQAKQLRQQLLQRSGLPQEAASQTPSLPQLVTEPDR